jgi:hypothetical protein
MNSEHTFTHTFKSCHIAQKSNHKQKFDLSHEQFSTVPPLPYVLVWRVHPWEPEGSAAHHLSVKK